MPDFNTKKEILRRLRAKKERNKALWLPCTAAELCVKAWYAVICRAGLALSDKNGKFLGIGTSADKPKTKRQDDIVYVRKPLFGRVLSAVLAACFIMMFMPDMDLSVSAVSIDYKGEKYASYAEDGVSEAENLYYLEKDRTLAEGKYVTISEYKVGYGAVQVFWEGAEDADGFTIDVYQKGTSMPVKSQQALEGSEYAIISGLAHDPNTTYEIRVIPYYNIQLYKYTPAIHDPNDPTQDVEATMAELRGRTFEQSGTATAASKKNVGSLNSSMANPSLEPIKYDNNVTATLTWGHVNQISGPDAGQDYTYAEGYIVYVRTVDGETSKVTPYKEIERVTDIRQGINLNNGKVSCEVTVEQGVIYEFYVKAYRSVFGPSGYHEDNPGMITSGGENTQKPTRLTTTPTKPKNLKVTSNKKDTLSLTWGAGAGSCTGYIVYRSEKKLDEATMKSFTADIAQNPYYDAATGEWDYSRYIREQAVELSTVNKSTKKYDNKDPLFENAKTYHYYVMAYLVTDSSGASVYGLPAYASGSIGASILPPTDIETEPGDGQITVTWNRVPGADGYILTITKDTDKDGNRVGEVSDPINWTDTKYVHKTFKGKKILNGEQYTYSVQSYVDVKTATEDILKSAAISATDKVGVLLGTPQDLKLTTTDGAVKIDWSAVKGAEGYFLYYSVNGGSFIEEPIEVSKPGYSHTGLNNNDRYTYYVVAYKTVNGEIVRSDATKTAWIIVGVPLDAPKDFKGTTGDGRVDLTWSAVSGAQGYILHIVSSNGSEQTIDLSKPGFQHTGLNNGDVYTYYVQAYKTVNGIRIYSDDSTASANRVTFTVGDTLDSPKDFNAVTTDGQVDLSWTAVKGAEGYVLYAYGNGRSYQFDLSKTKYQHTGLQNGDRWTYYLAAYKTVNGRRVYSSPTRSITVDIGVSLNAAIDLIATAGNRQVDLSWSAVKGAEGYVVYLYNTKTMEFEPITVVSKTKYSHTGLKNGQKYTYMVAPFKTVNGERRFGEYSMSVDAIPSTGSNTDIDHSLNVRGTTPYGISHSEYISAAANHGAFDESVDVYFSTNKESTEAVKDVLKNYADGLKSFIIYPFDISIYEEGTLVEIDPYDGYSVTVTMPIPDRLIAYRDYITVVHIGERSESEEGIEEIGGNDISADDWIHTSAGSLEVLPSAVVDIDNVWCIQFVCSSFSPYAFVIYKEHILDVSAGGGVIASSFADSFNSGLLLFTAFPDILPNNKKLKVVVGGRKRYRIKSIEKSKK